MGRIGSEWCEFPAHFFQQLFAVTITKNPGILAAATLRRIDDQGAFAQRDAREAAGNQSDFFAHKNVGAQVDVARLDAAVDEARSAGERKRGLRNVVSRIGQNTRAKFLPLLRGALRANEHAIPAGFAHGFHHHVL